MPESGDAKLFEVLRRQARKDLFGYLILAERSLILSKAKAPQPTSEVHGGAHASPWSISSSERPGEVSGWLGGWENG
jgi:hypothetical protein